MLKMKVALFRKAQGVDARALCLAKCDHNILRFSFIFKISRARPDVAVVKTDTAPTRQRRLHAAVGACGRLRTTGAGAFEFAAINSSNSIFVRPMR